MRARGAVPGEGPRDGWHGNETWDETRNRNFWNSYAQRSQHVLASADWLQRHRPEWLGTELGEDVPQQRARPEWSWGPQGEMVPLDNPPQTDWQYTGPEQSDEHEDVEPHGGRGRWGADAARGSND